MVKKLAQFPRNTLLLRLLLSTSPTTETIDVWHHGTKSLPNHVSGSVLKAVPEATEETIGGKQHQVAIMKQRWRLLSDNIRQEPSLCSVGSTRDGVVVYPLPTCPPTTPTSQITPQFAETCNHRTACLWGCFVWRTADTSIGGDGSLAKA
ncbi:hypothetical protein EGR_09135 [Echinococcus granulosus]|uniref:Secreted protein n=1 Tax=Echinococcus granulosus TaxID=6210 RepID=W6U4G5_ECHGR|nr:hypothetical protein EGR_09135 [Echinococcus granulosus]EUB56010.1 hypothetical protein EGR_09135 [Echinococcus granulosus]